MRMYYGNHIADSQLEERFFCPECGKELSIDEECKYCEDKEKEEIINEFLENEKN